MLTSQVIIVGAGPSGLLLALLLSKKRITVQVLEAAAQLDAQPRATHYSAPAVRELRRAGVLEDMLKEGFVPKGVSWRKLDGTVLAELETGVLPPEYPDKMVCLPLDRLGKILAGHLAQQQTAEVKYGYKVVRIDQDEKQATVVVETKDGEQTLSADFVVGCDGANSKIRRSLFGDWEFPGKTWDRQIVATNVCGPPLRPLLIVSELST
jgi:2-polyprenyl-6-methoxyphenol hydroxylase-like FAD-dependent oxidoreductase